MTNEHDDDLPTWKDCKLRHDNSAHITARIARGGAGEDYDSQLASPLHGFIYEYEDADEIKARWFRRRLSALIAEVDQRARRDEREKCAQECESIHDEYHGEDVLATWCAQAIRAKLNPPAGKEK